MITASAVSDTVASVEAVADVVGQLHDRNIESPSLLVVYATEDHDHGLIVDRLSAAFPGVQLHGATSCLGVMNEAGYAGSGTSLGLFAVEDPDGAYGSAVADFSGALAENVSRAVRTALENTEVAGVVPEAVWLDACPGQEEAVIASIQAVVGDDVPIIGGSAADNGIAGRWRVFGRGTVSASGVAVSVLMPSVRVSFAFHSGYAPTRTIGRVTSAAERTVHTIDGRPAAEVYNEWTGGAIADEVASGGNVLAKSTLFPLGRQSGVVRGVPDFRLSHPETVQPDGSLTLFSTCDQGDHLVLMRGTQESLVERAGRVVKSALDANGWRQSDVAGALVIYCAGCMLAVRDRMDVVVREIRKEMDVPFLGAFTFGEQGCFIGGGNYHGNLMISTLVFGNN